jgi:hypothetical protein
MNIDINKLQNIIIAFELPFALDLKDCNKPEDEGIPFIVLLNSIPAQLRIERHYNESAIGNGVKLAPFSKIKNDRYGFLSKTKVQIWFDNQTFDNIPIDKSLFLVSSKYFLQLSITYLNKFLADYRSTTREYWIRPLKEQNILSYQHILLDEDSNQDTCSCLLNNEVHFNGGQEISIEKDQESNLRKLLLLQNNNLYDNLLLSAFDNLDLGNFNNTIIQCSILFENFVYTTLDGKLSKRKLDKIKRNVECNCFLGVYQVCKSGLKVEFDSDFGDSEEFINFHKQVLQTRNNLVHGTQLESVSYLDAKNAIAITLKAIEKLKSELTII